MDVARRQAASRRRQPLTPGAPAVNIQTQIRQVDLPEDLVRIWEGCSRLMQPAHLALLLQRSIELLGGSPLASKPLLLAPFDEALRRLIARFVGPAGAAVNQIPHPNLFLSAGANPRP